MTYCQYVEGRGNGIFHRKYFEDYRTIGACERAVAKWAEGNRVAILGWVSYTFNGNRERKYSRESYRLLGRFNAKVFFDYWS